MGGGSTSLAAVTDLAPRPFSALGYPPPSAEAADAASIAEELTFVLDAQRISKWAPSGMSVRHYGLHLALHPDRPDKVAAVLVGRAANSAETWLEIEQHDSVERALAWVNEIAYSVAGDYAPPWRPNALDLTRAHWERALASHPDNPSGHDPEERLLDERLASAIDRFLALYRRYGGWRYHGRPDASDPAGYAGPIFWQEEDVRFRLAYELEREFPSAVHLNSLLSPATVEDWDVGQDGKHQYADILLDDLRDFVPGADALRQFATRTAIALVEIKFLRRRRQARDLEGDLEGVVGDATRLGRHRQLGRAQRALMVVVDDDGRLPSARETMPWPAGVDLLHAGPTPNGKRVPPPPWGALSSTRT